MWKLKESLCPYTDPLLLKASLKPSIQERGALLTQFNLLSNAASVGNHKALGMLRAIYTVLQIISN